MAVVNVTAFGSSSSCSICPGWDVSMGHTTNTQKKQMLNQQPTAGEFGPLFLVVPNQVFGFEMI
jgi:hypothetical protein